jgi:hypothetical protein
MDNWLKLPPKKSEWDKALENTLTHLRCSREMNDVLREEIEELKKENVSLKQRNKVLNEMLDFDRNRLSTLDEKLREVRKLFEQEFRDFEAEEICN